MMNNHRLLAGALVATLLSGSVCASGYDRREMSLESLFELAESQSIQLRPYFTAEDEARRSISVARSQRLPDINTSLSLSYIGDGFTTDRTFADYQRAPIPHFGNSLNINITQPLYAGGAINGTIEMAELRSAAAAHDTELQRDNLRLRITGFYLDIYKYSNLRTVVDNNIAQARQVLAEMEARYTLGVALQNDITRYELLVSNLELERVRIDNTLDILNNNIVTITGLPDGTVVVPDSTILSRTLSVTSESNWQQEAYKQSPAIGLARTGVGICRAGETLARSELLPKVGLQAGWSIDGPILVEIPPVNRNLSYWYVGIGVSYNLSSLYKGRRELERSRTATRLATERLDAVSENVRLDVRADYIRYLEAYEELKTQTKSVELAERNYHTTATRYAADMALITDMLDAANSKLDAEQRLVNARINIIYYYYKLLFTTGQI